jgi:zinc protease
MLNRINPPKAASIEHFKIKEAQSQRLNNGITLHWIDAGEHDILQLEILLRSGKWFETINGTSFFTSKMLFEGTGSRTSSEISEFFESFGVQVHVNPGNDFISVSALCLNKYFREIIPVLLDCLLQPSFPSGELDILKDLQIQQTKVNNEKGSYVASKEFRRMIFGEDHPYGKPLEMNDIDDHITPLLLKTFHSDRLFYQPELILTGKVREEYLTLLESNFAGISLSSLASEGFTSRNKSASSQKKIIGKPGSLQSSVRYGKKIIPKTHPDYSGLLVLNELLGGFFGSRLMKNLREEKGYTYGIHSSVINYINDSYFVISADFIKENTRQAIDEINKEIVRLQAEDVKLNELEMVKNYMLGGLLSDLETSFSLAEKFKAVYFYGLDYRFYDLYVQTIRNITPGTLRELAIKHLSITDFSLVIVGDDDIPSS